MQTRRQRTISARIILCWVLAIQIVLSQQAGWEVNFLTKPPGATVEIGKPFEVMFEIVDQQGKRVGPGVLVTVSLTGATFNGDSTIMTQTDKDGRVRLVGLIPVGAGPITLRIVATVPGAPAPMVQRSLTWEAVNPTPPVGTNPTNTPAAVKAQWAWWKTALIVGGAAVAAGSTLAVTRGGEPPPPPSLTVSPGTPTIRAPR